MGAHAVRGDAGATGAGDAIASAEDAGQRRQEWAFAEFGRRAQDYEEGAELIRQLLARGGRQGDESIAAGQGF